MTIPSLLAELGAHAGLPGVTLDENGACRLIFDDKVSLDLEQHPEQADTLLLHSVVGTVPPEDKREFFLSLLQANHRASSSTGIVHSVVPNSQEVVLWKSLSVRGMDVEQLTAKLTETVCAARAAAAAIETIPGEEPAADNVPSPSAMIRV